MSDELDLGSITPDVMAELLCRFVMNLPLSELRDWNRFCYHLEKMWWFYLDKYAFYLDKYAKGPLSLSQIHYFAHNNGSFRRFAAKALAQILGQTEEEVCVWVDPIITEYAAYKRSIPVAGCILLNRDTKEVLMIKPFMCDRWAFPKGKQNNGESFLETAIRETAEETGHQLLPDDLKGSELIRPTKDTYFFVAVLTQEQIRLSRERARGKMNRFEVDRVEWVLLTGATDKSVELTSLAKIAWPIAYAIAYPFQTNENHSTIPFSNK